MDLEFLHQLEPAQIRELVPKYLSEFIGEPDAAAVNLVRISTMFANRSDEELSGMLQTVVNVGSDHLLCQANPMSRDMMRNWTQDVIPNHSLDSVEHLRSAMSGRPVILLGNHLSYYDIAALDCVLAWEGHVDLADHIAIAAGPKVYANLFRRFAASAMNSLRVPQSTSFEHTEDLSPIDLARKALASVNAAHDAIGQGYALLIYAEGSRSRTGRLRPFLRAVHRYLKLDDALIVPTAVTGADKMFPVGGDKIMPADVAVRFGAPLSVSEIGGSKAALEAGWHALAEILPDAYKPTVDEPALA